MNMLYLVIQVDTTKKNKISTIYATCADSDDAYANKKDFTLNYIRHRQCDTYVNKNTENT